MGALAAAAKFMLGDDDEASTAEVRDVANIVQKYSCPRSLMEGILSCGPGASSNVAADASAAALWPTFRAAAEQALANKVTEMWKGMSSHLTMSSIWQAALLVYCLRLAD